MKKIFYIFCGGFLGAILRALLFNIQILNVKSLFPLNTIVVNLLGCFFLSLISYSLEKKIKFNDNLYSAITVGLIGAFTTFSTFSKDLGILIYSNFWLYAIVYLLISIVGGFICVFLGYKTVEIACKKTKTN
ncbi:MAG: CrcB family protein [Peptostreptococcus sp.]|uniref:fluoride efflux transporter FluC n=1 Tax=Peptostreptococcus sp. TaxID=1262 RepID=UPI002FC7D5F5